ncbi:MAG: S9 family peptidase [Caldilineae bacterium]|nr:S9 family peptidase [Caldilineae bacterium]
MNPTIEREDRHGWPAQPRPDRKLPEPWTPELLTGWGHIHHHSLSPDGQQIAFVWQREGNCDLYVQSLPGSTSRRETGTSWPRRLTFDRPAQAAWTDGQPRWSPDGRSLVYAARSDIWLVDVDGQTRPRRLTDGKKGDSSPIFSPDGNHVYFVSGRGDFENLCYTTPAGDWPVALTRFDGDVSDPQPSPDGRQVAFVYHPQDDLDRWEICVVPAEGGEVRHLTGAAGVWDSQPRWSPDGTTIAFTSNRSGWVELYMLTLASGELRQVTSGAADVTGFAWSPGGRRMVMAINHNGAADLHLLQVASGELKPLRAAAGWHSLPQWSPDRHWLTVEFETPANLPDIWRVDTTTGEAHPLTGSTPPALMAAGMVEPEFTTFISSDEATIPGLLFRPPAASPAAPCPAIVYPHGGPTDEHGRYFDMVAQWLVAKGYAVLAPNYRGSTGYGLAHQHALHGNWGIADCDDMLAAADYLAGLDWVDGERLGIYGASYGSYLATLALARDDRQPRRFKCGVAKYGDCDILASWAQGDRPGREDLERQMGHPTTNRAGYHAGSPVYDVENIQAPLLILHGADDERVHPKQSEQLVEALKRHDKTFELFVYEGEGHGFLQTSTLQHFYATLGRFLDWYLL